MILIPQPAGPWASARRIVGDGRRSFTDGAPFYNDFCLVDDVRGRWHAFGIWGDPQDGVLVEDRLFHSVADRIDGEWRAVEPVPSGLGRSPAIHMWAPFAFRDGSRTLLFYAHSVVADGRYGDWAMRVLVSEDPDLVAWAPLDLGGGDNIAFRHGSARDAQVVRRGSGFLMYYVSGEASSEARVFARTSADLLAWSEPIAVLGTPPGYQAAESIFAIERDGLQYLWVCGHDYGLMSLYVSADPLDFGAADRDRVMEQSGHAPEVVEQDGRHWIACCAIASRAGGGPAAHDLPGVYLQPLEWRPATPDEESRVRR